MSNMLNLINKEIRNIAVADFASGLPPCIGPLASGATRTSRELGACIHCYSDWSLAPRQDLWPAQFVITAGG